MRGFWTVFGSALKRFLGFRKPNNHIVHSFYAVMRLIGLCGYFFRPPHYSDVDGNADVDENWKTFPSSPEPWIAGPRKGKYRKLYVCYAYMCVYVYTIELSYRLKSDIVSGQYRSAIGPKVNRQHILSMNFVIYIVDRWSVVKLTGSMYSLCALSSACSIDARS